MKRVLKEKGESVLLGNEAITRGALEAGVQFASTYPGTPASEIGDTFSKIAKQGEATFYFEYGTNEKTALEAGIGASYSGLKTLVAMKHFGLNVCSDSFLPFVYTGTNGPTVIVVADDPSCHSSGQSEQNTRAYGELAHVPILEPSDPKEAKEFVKKGFKISEKYNVPVMIRLTTRVSHQRQIVPLEEIKEVKPKAEFKKNFDQYVTMPPRVLELKQELLDKIKELKKEAEDDSLNFVDNDKNSELGIITSGVSYLHTKEAVNKLGLEIPIFKLGYFYPLPENKIKEFVKKLDKVLVVEELEPYLEEKINSLAKDFKPELEILGEEQLSSTKKKFGKELSSEVEELKPEYIAAALAEITGTSYEISSIDTKSIKHIPRFCDQCPYWRMFAAVKKAIKESSDKIDPDQVVFGGDIGCYMMSGLPHTGLQDYLLNMGSSIGIAHGIEKALEISSNESQKAIAFIGDSTFFHAGIPALINSVYNQSGPLIIAFDNRITAMTGHQPNPGMEKTGMGKEAPKIRIEEIAEACGVEKVKVLDPTEEFDKMVETIKEYLLEKKTSVIVAKHICWLIEK